ncbi:heterokaryon incompatibility [Fusarium sporotrichioides]|uniref:Heterokaryon incompatibility n=1 Tax=Fusarium sporotrichioides TaxID=5514 RepID=A0A395SGT4_FUSSP|nr:heterokaryon incompatibility [Fusarium sporotrichioides]
MRYSGCALSFPSDKLVAFSAIARLYECYLSDDYVAGMWCSHLQGDLLWWACSNDKGVPTRYEAYIAPTWSWASIKGNMFTAGDESDRVEYLHEVDDYKLEYATKDKMGAIRSGWIRLSGQLRQLELRRKATEGKKMWSLFIGKIEYDLEQYMEGETGASMVINMA